MNETNELINNIKQIRLRINELENVVSKFSINPKIILRNKKQIRLRINELKNVVSKFSINPKIILRNKKRTHLIEELKAIEINLNNEFIEKINSNENNSSLEFQLKLYGRMLAETTNVVHVNDAAKTATDDNKVHLFKALSKAHENAVNSIESANIAKRNGNQNEYTILMAKYGWYKKDLKSHSIGEYYIESLDNLEQELGNKKVI